MPGLPGEGAPIMTAAVFFIALTLAFAPSTLKEAPSDR